MILNFRKATIYPILRDFMPNECLFFLHVAAVFLFTFGALRIGKETLGVWICLQALFANLFVLKQIVLFGFQVTATDVFAVGGILGLNLMNEFYGKESAKKTSVACLYSVVLFALLSKVHLLYTPSSEDITQTSYSILLDPAPRLFIASIVVFFIVQKIDLHLFGKLKSRMKKSPFALRNLISASLSQLLDTVLFTFIGLYGIISSPLAVIFVSFFIKFTVMATLAPSSFLAKRLLKPKEIVL